MTAKHYITTKRLKPGKYVVTRDDGRVFNILRSFLPIRGKTRWIIEDAETYFTDSASTLSSALADIKHEWIPLTKTKPSA